MPNGPTLPTRARHWWVAPPVAGVLLLAACDSDPAPDPEEPSSAPTASTPAPATSDAAVTSAAPEPAEPEVELAEQVWRNEEITPMSRPTEAGGVAVMYTREDDDLYITGLDPNDGEVLWSHPATPSYSPGGIALTVREIDGVVAYLEPGRDPGEEWGSPAHLVLLDAATGDEVGRTPRQHSFASLPAPCEAGSDRFCVDASSGAGWESRGVSERGTLVAPPTGSRLDGWSGIGSLGLSRQNDDSSQIGRIVEGDVHWQVDTAEVFAEGHSTGSGWTFQAINDDAALVGTIGISSPDTQSVQLADYLTVALDADSGEVLWRAESADMFCDVNVTGEPEDPLLACRWESGTLTSQEGGSELTDGQVALIRLDTASGEAMWTVDLGTAQWEAAHPGDVSVAVLDAEHVLAPSDDGPIVIALADGTTRPADADDVVWEQVRVFAEVSILGREAEQSGVTGSLIAGPLTPDADPVTEIPWPLPHFVGAEVDELRVVGDEDGVTAYRSTAAGGGGG